MFEFLTVFIFIYLTYWGVVFISKTLHFIFRIKYDTAPTPLIDIFSSTLLCLILNTLLKNNILNLYIPLDDGYFINTLILFFSYFTNLIITGALLNSIASKNNKKYLIILFTFILLFSNIIPSTVLFILK